MIRALLRRLRDFLFPPKGSCIVCGQPVEPPARECADCHDARQW